METKSHEIHEGDVYANGEKHRRVIGVRGGVVVYSKGTETNGMCKLGTFRRWLRRQETQQIHAGAA